jgi:glycosyltransferase involved in cell wall biosynthesis
VRPKHLITPGIDMSLFTDRSITKDIDIMAAGSLIPLKRYDLLIEIIAEIKKQRTTLTALLAGDGPMRSSLQQQINNAGLEQSVALSGELPYQEIIKKMQQSKIFLHTSSYEGFGCVCLEALAAGASVISFTQPMKQLPVNWYVVTTKEEMIGRTLQLLNNAPTTTILRDYTIEETVLKIGELFQLR